VRMNETKKQESLEVESDPCFLSLLACFHMRADYDCAMATIAEIEKLAQDLSENDRAVLAAHLLGSLPPVLHDEDGGNRRGASARCRARSGFVRWSVADIAQSAYSAIPWEQRAKSCGRGRAVPTLKFPHELG
jgi:hypothetical protein